MQTEQDDREVLNLTEAAAFIRVSQKTLRKMAREKRLPCRKVGREWRFLRRGPALMALLRGQRCV